MCVVFRHRLFNTQEEEDRAVSAWATRGIRCTRFNNTFLALDSFAAQVTGLNYPQSPGSESFCRPSANGWRVCLPLEISAVARTVRPGAIPNGPTPPSPVQAGPGHAVPDPSGGSALAAPRQYPPAPLRHTVPDPLPTLLGCGCGGRLPAVLPLEEQARRHLRTPPCPAKDTSPPLTPRGDARGVAGKRLLGPPVMGLAIRRPTATGTPAAY